jgi:arabinose-5-phosphate isomerase
MIETKNHYEIGKQVIHKEINELIKLEAELSLEFDHTIESIRRISGKVIVTGIGKSGHIGRKIAATLSSTGTPSVFMHPSEACHGDIGMLGAHDIIIIISYSGEADEIITLLPTIKRNNIKIICLSGNKNSTLAKNSNHFISIKVTEEACPLGLAPTSSTTKTLALGDAIAIALLKSKDFKPSDFAISHPAGSLGRKLLTKVSDLMHEKN